MRSRRSIRASRRSRSCWPSAIGCATRRRCGWRRPSGVEALVPEEGDGAGALLTRATTELESAAAFDPELESLAERLAALRYEAEDVAAELRGYLDRLEAEPGRLEVVEERLAAVRAAGA